MSAPGASLSASLAQRLPLLARRDLSAPLAWREGVAQSAGLFIAQAQALAARWPGSAQPINLCQDRYLFALGLAAALLRGQTTLMPPNVRAETLRQLPQPPGQALIVLCDEDDLDSAGLAQLRVSADARLTPARAVPEVDAALQAVCLLTSGSTGLPQPHSKTWGTLVANIGAQAERLAQLLDSSDLSGLTLVATVPAQHSYGLESSVLLALLGGACLHSGRPFYPADIADALAGVPAPRALVTTPFHLKTLLLAGLPLPPTELLLSATAPLSPQLAQQAETALAGRLIEIYGCTEAGQVASRRTTAGEVWQTLGGLRLAAQHSAVEANGDTTECYIVSGGHVALPTPLADILELIDSCHFRLLGRANDLIHVAGKRGSLAHLNFHLNRITGIVDGVFWLPDPIAETVVRPIVFVVAPGLSAAQVIAALRQRLESAFVPRRVVFVSELPREATGKLGAAVLRPWAQALLAARATPPLARAAGSAVPGASVAAAAAGAADSSAAPGTAVAAAAPRAADSGAAPGAAVAGGAPGAAALSAGALQAEIHIAPDHPAFAGHFPGQPVLPGAVLISLVLQAAAAQPELAARLGATPRIDQLKCLAPVGPGARLQLRLAPRAGGRGLGFEVHEGERVVARGALGSGA